MNWQEQAACRGMALDHGYDEHPFYPGRGGQMTHIKAVCRGCPVRQQCLDYALDNYEMYGIWGGLSTDERLAIRRKGREPNVEIDKSAPFASLVLAIDALDRTGFRSKTKGAA